MGTRSRIGVMHGNVCKSVYCHWDGYLDHNGRILQEHYDSARANHLVALGDISSLGVKIGDAHPFSKFEINNESPDFDKLMATHEQAEKEGWTTFYGRDRGETGTEFKSAMTFADFMAQVENCGAEYYYIMKDGVWYTGCPGEGDALIPLATALTPVAKTWETVDL
jgi:hypothetical protein